MSPPPGRSTCRPCCGSSPIPAWCTWSPPCRRSCARGAAGRSCSLPHRRRGRCPAPRSAALCGSSTSWSRCPAGSTAGPSAGSTRTGRSVGSRSASARSPGRKGDCSSAPVPASPGAACRQQSGRRRSSRCDDCSKCGDVMLWVNGEVVPADRPVVLAHDHGLVVGDGVFETCEVKDGVVFALTRHLRRLHDSARGLGLEIDDALIRSGVQAVLADRPESARLRITVTGGPSPYGSERGAGPPTVIVATAAMHAWPPTTDVAVVPWVRNERAATAGLKTTSYADNVVALAWAKARGADEAIFANTRGELCEGTGSNVFVAQDGKLVTPPLTSGCLGGITRELLLEWMPGDIEERALPIAALAESAEAFITSTTRSVMPIRAVDGVPLTAAPGPLTKRAAEVFARRAAENPDP